MDQPCRENCVAAGAGTPRPLFARMPAAISRGLPLAESRRRVSAIWYWTVSYAGKYATMLSLDEGVEYAKENFATISHAAPLLWIIAGLGLACLCLARWHLTRGFSRRLFCFLLPRGLSGVLFPAHYYFIVLVPSVVLFAGLAVSWSGRWLLKNLPRRGCAIFRSCWRRLLRRKPDADRAVLFTLPPREACVPANGAQPFPESLDVARYIEQNTRKDQRIAVIGSEPEIYFDAHRHSSTAQIYMYRLTSLSLSPVKCRRTLSARSNKIRRNTSSLFPLPLRGGIASRTPATGCSTG